MDIHAATEQAYRNGYEAGKAVGAPKWIPVKERLPTKEDADTKGNVQVVFMGWVTTWNWRNISRVCEISHWMPLPNPPTE